MSTLNDYLSAKSISQKAFADLLGVDQSIVSRLSRRAMRPSLELAFAIERATDGAVLAGSWLAEPDQAQGAT
jgi:DNA-binding transcriptional regulator YdaS (Cro superfamily)